jgi:CRISPR-associated protein Cas5d
MKAERFSYPIITPSAARGVFDAIYWDGKREKEGIRPYFYWQVTRIEMLEMPRYIALMRNEVKDKAPSVRTIKAWMDGREIPEPIIADGGKDELGTDQKGRTQRQTMALKNVRYRLSAKIVPKSVFAADWGKMNGQFQRRARAGKCFQQPYFGCREFPAFFEYIEDPDNNSATPAPVDQHLGFMLYDVFDLEKEVVGEKDKPFISLFDAHVRNGVLDVPAFFSDAVRKPWRSRHAE